MSISHNTTKSKTVRHNLATEPEGIFCAEFTCRNGEPPSAAYVSIRPNDHRRRREWREVSLDTVRDMRAILDAIIEAEDRTRTSK